MAGTIYDGDYMQLWRRAAHLAGPCFFLVRQSDGAILDFDREMTSREATRLNELLEESGAGREWLPRHGVVYLPGWVLKLLLEAEEVRSRIIATNSEYLKIRNKSKDLQQQSKAYRQRGDDLMVSDVRARSEALRQRSAAILRRSSAAQTRVR